MSSKRYDTVIIGGFGHVGLPLGIALADRGLQVALYDINKALAEKIRAGEMPFLEYGAEEVLKRTIGRTLHVVDSLSQVSEGKSIIITIGTPLDEYMNPKLLPMLELAGRMLPHLDSTQHVILRSTVYPGTSERFALYFEERGMKIGIAFCPERIVQGYALQELPKLPQIISATTPATLDYVAKLFGVLGVETVEVEVKEAELAKLFNNTWRYIKFAIANQFYMIANDLGVDFNRVHHAMTKSYDRAKSFPKAGFAAGPCLLKDTMQLSAFYNNQFMLGHAAMLINEGLPAYIINAMIGTDTLPGKTVGILGMAFKGDIDDTRDSLSFKLMKLLRFHGAETICSDEFATDATFVSKEELLSRSDIIILGAPHSAYRDLALPDGKQVIDIWGFWSLHEDSSV